MKPANANVYSSNITLIFDIDSFKGKVFFIPLNITSYIDKKKAKFPIAITLCIGQKK